MRYPGAPRRNVQERDREVARVRPRQAFGQQPGRLAATMLRALSAELSDPSRYARGKAYARDGAVIDIEVRPGEVAGEVLGSRRDAYRVSLFADPAPRRGGSEASLASPANVVPMIPDRTEISIDCTCPDASGGLMCKHAIATLLVFADEVSIEPELLARWRGRDDGERSEPARRAQREPAPRVDVLAPLLASPAPLPPPPNLRSLDPKPTPRASRTAHTDLLDELLADAIATIRR